MLLEKLELQNIVEAWNTLADFGMLDLVSLDMVRWIEIANSSQLTDIAKLLIFLMNRPGIPSRDS